MKQVLAIFLKSNKEIEKVRKRYIINPERYSSHITLVYPFEFKNQNQLNIHISEALKKFKPFEISLCGIQKSAKEYYLYLLVDGGKEKIVSLHEKLNSGILANFKNDDMPQFIPHLSIGAFNSEEEIDTAMKKISKINLFLKMKVKTIQLLTINKDHSLKSKKDFIL